MEHGSGLEEFEVKILNFFHVSFNLILRYDLNEDYLCSFDLGRNLWSQVIAEEEAVVEEEEERRQPRHLGVTYSRRRAGGETNSYPVDKVQVNVVTRNRQIVSNTGIVNRVSWNRSLSTRGRSSIAAAAYEDYHPGEKKQRRRARPPLPKGKSAVNLNFDKEKAYFEVVDSCELLEESPSPKNFGTWIMGGKCDDMHIPHFSTVLEKSSLLEKWLRFKKLSSRCGPSGPLLQIEELQPMTTGNDLDTWMMRTPDKVSQKMHSVLHSIRSKFHLNMLEEEMLERHISSVMSNQEPLILGDDELGKIEDAIRKLSLTSCGDPFSALLSVCNQSAPSTLMDVLSKYCEPTNIVKLGEGTYGEAFKAGNTVCKIVPIDGDLLVNGETQKKSDELVEEAVLSRTLNQLRGHAGQVQNVTSSFIETLDIQVCEGPYDETLIKAWEDWDEKHGSENDHPKEFPIYQRYVIFVLEHGGKDLERFVLMNFDEARSLLVQITAALAVAEVAFEFEHRDLHWGNILLSRKESEMLQIVLEGRQILVHTYGLHVSIIDFTLSRINTGEDILFLDLSLDPELFQGPKGDKQAETYRKMKEVTADCWEGSYPKTNVLWLQYVVDILLLKKAFKRTTKDERELRSLKKRLNSYKSSKEALQDPFFKDMLVDKSM
ncbi:unnamed protein product [Rhodiola kirilowii]